MLTDLYKFFLKYFYSNNEIDEKKNEFKKPDAYKNINSNRI